MAAEGSHLKFIYYFQNRRPYEDYANVLCREVIFNRLIDNAKETDYMERFKPRTKIDTSKNRMSFLLREGYTIYFERLRYTNAYNEPSQPDYRPEEDMSRAKRLYFDLFKYAINVKRAFFNDVVLPYLCDMTHNTVSVGRRKLKKFSRTPIKAKPVDHLVNDEPVFNATIFRSNGLLAIEYALTYIILWRLYDPDYFIPDVFIDVKEYEKTYPDTCEKILYDRVNAILSLLPKTPMDLVRYFAFNPVAYLSINGNHIREDIYMLLFYMLTRKYTFPVLGDFTTNYCLQHGGNANGGLLRTYTSAVEDLLNTKLWWIRSDSYTPETCADPTNHIESIVYTAEEINQAVSRYGKVTD